MRISLPKNLPESLRDIDCCVDDISLITTLEKSISLPIEFFEYVEYPSELEGWSRDVWGSDEYAFLRGRVHELVCYTLENKKGQNLNISAERLNALAQTICDCVNLRQGLLYSPLRQPEKLFALLSQKGEFIEQISQDRFVAGKLFERARQIVLNDPTGGGANFQYLSAYDKSSLYLLMADLTETDEGFFACVSYLKENKTFNELLEYIKIISDIPSQIKYFILEDTSVETTIQKIQNYITSEKKTVLSTPARKQQFRKIKKKIINTWEAQSRSGNKRDSTRDTFYLEGNFSHEQQELPNDLKYYEEDGVFFDQFIDYCRSCQNPKKQTKFIKFLVNLHIEPEFLRFAYFLKYNDETLLKETKERFEAYRKTLSYFQKCEIYQTLQDKVAASSSPGTSLSTSPE